MLGLVSMILSYLYCARAIVAVFFFTRKKIVPSRKISDVRMPRIPSVSTTNSNPGSRSSSGLVVREQSREQLLG